VFARHRGAQRSVFVSAGGANVNVEQFALDQYALPVNVSMSIVHDV
jgi:hypothetical protein